MGRLCASILMFALAVPARAQDALASFEAQLARTRNSLNSLSYEIEVVTVSNSNGVLRISNSMGTIEKLRIGDKWLERSDVKAVSTIKPGNIEVRTEDSDIYDGETLFQFTSIDGGAKKYFKVKVFAKFLNDDLHDYDLLKAKADIKLLPDDQLNDESVFVLDAKLKAAPEVILRHFYSKTTGLWMGSKMKSADGTTTTTITRKNVKINPEIKAELFVFTPPPGVTVEDRTEELNDALKRK